MKLYLKDFKTTADYNAYTADTANFVKPNVSFIEETNGVAYHPYDPYNGHAYVEIGGLKWATMNVGATSITDYGLYFQWGDTQGYTAAQVGSGEGQKYFGWADYKYSEGGTDSSYGTITKYNRTDGKTVLEAVDDAAQVNWGGSWRMPTEAEFQALGNATTSAWTNDYQGSGVAGLLLTDKTDSSKVLFFPGAGYCSIGYNFSVGYSGYYWSSSLFSSGVDYAYQLEFYKNVVNWHNSSDRCRGYAVRGVVG